MVSESKGNRQESVWAKILQGVIVAIITSIGTILAAIVSQPTLWAIMNPRPDQVTIAVTNKNCFPLDLYVDDEKKAASVVPNTSMLFKIKPGEYWINTCVAGTKSCSDYINVTWTRSTNQLLARHPTCP